MHTIINIREILYSVGNMQKVSSFFEKYGGWNRVGKYTTPEATLQYWGLPSSAAAEEILIQSNHVENGQIRLIAFDKVEQKCIRSSQQPWDTGGIMDINLRVHEVEESFEQLKEMGFHGLSDPLLQVMGPFKLYDILMRGYDDTIIAFTHRLEPPMELTAQIHLPTHVYKSTITVRDLEEAREFYVDKLGYNILSEYKVTKDSPQENMFGLPFNLADKVTCHAIILSPHGGKDTDFQIVYFEGVDGKDHSNNAKVPNKGFLLYRVELKNISDYHTKLQKEEKLAPGNITTLEIHPYGQVQCFSLSSPNKVIWEFFEIIN